MYRNATYPRDENTGLGANSESATQTHRLLRRGIPFGASFGAAVGGGANDKRGLCFLAYQNNLANHFEFVQKSWVNDPAFPFFPPGNTALELSLGEKSDGPAVRRPKRVLGPVGKWQLAQIQHDFWVRYIGNSRIRLARVFRGFLLPGGMYKQDPSFWLENKISVAKLRELYEQLPEEPGLTRDDRISLKTLERFLHGEFSSGTGPDSLYHEPDMPAE